jgi:pilus assembly protein Flp/PilA
MVVLEKDGKMLAKIFKFLRKSKGATAIEYALIASLIAVVAIAGMKTIGNSILNKLNHISNSIES